MWNKQNNTARALNKNLMKTPDKKLNKVAVISSDQASNGITINSLKKNSQNATVDIEENQRKKGEEIIISHEFRWVLLLRERTCFLCFAYQ